MPRLRFLKFLALVITLQVLLALPGLVWPRYLDSPIGLALVAPYFSAYILHAIGVPGLLQNNGACGWGWCAPSVLGWLVIFLTWFLSVLTLTWLLSRIKN